MISEEAEYSTRKAIEAKEKGLLLAAAHWYEHAASESTGEDEAIFRGAAYDCRRKHYEGYSYE